MNKFKFVIFSVAHCESKFIQTQAIAAGLAISCEYVGHDWEGITLEECKTKAYQMGGNAFNYRPLDSTPNPGECNIKKCSSNDLHYTKPDLGWDVYADVCLFPGM